MGRLWIDGFEYGSSAGVFATLYSVSSMQVSSAGVGHTGICCMWAQYGGSYASRILLASKSELFAKIHYSPSSVAQTAAVMGFYKGANCICWIRQVNRDLELYSGTGTGTLIGTITNALSPVGSNYNYIELHWKIDASAGVAQLRSVVGTNGIDFAGNTKPTADTDMDRATFGTVGGLNNGNNFYMDDLVIDDAAWIGNVRIAAIPVTGAGTTTQWSPSAGSNWDCVNEVPSSDTDFVVVNVVNQIDSYACADLPSGAVAAKTLMVIGRMSSDGVPTPTKAQLLVHTEGGDYLSGEDISPPAGSPGIFSHLWATNPSTGIDWTVAEVNAVEIGIKSLA